MFKHALCSVEKASREPGVIPFILTKRVVDRDGEVIEPKGAKIENFIKNPVFLWAHGRVAAIPPIGKILIDTIKITKDSVKADVKFDMEDAFATSIYNKYKNGFLSAGSIRFMPITFKEEPVLPGQRYGTYTEWELLEFSAVTVPANPEALARALGDEADENYDFYKEMKDFSNNKDFENTPEGYVKWLNHLEALKEEETGALGSSASNMDVPFAPFADSVPVNFRFADTIDPEAKDADVVKVLTNWMKDAFEFRPNVPIRLFTPMPEDHLWNPEEALKRLSFWTGEDLKWFQLRKAFAWVDINDPENINSYKFLHHDVIDDNLVTVWRGVALAMVELFRDTEIPENEKKIAYKHLLRHYEQYDKQKEAPEYKVYEAEEITTMEKKVIHPEEFETNTLSSDTVQKIIDNIKNA